MWLNHCLFVCRCVGIRGEDDGTLVCYKLADSNNKEKKARLQLKVLGIAIFHIIIIIIIIIIIYLHFFFHLFTIQ